MSLEATGGGEPQRSNPEFRDALFAMRLSLIFGFAMLIGKTAAYFMTHSAAVFSDAAESVIHVIAVGFASFSLRLSARPASGHFLYGYERIAIANSWRSIPSICLRSSLPSALTHTISMRTIIDRKSVV